MSAAGFPAALFAAGMRRAMGGHVCATSAGGGVWQGGGRLQIAPCRRTALRVGFPMAVVSHGEILPEPAKIFNWDMLPPSNLILPLDTGRAFPGRKGLLGRWRNGRGTGHPIEPQGMLTGP